MIPSRHLLSYSHGVILLFYLFFHHLTLVYISSLPDRKVPILLSLDFLPGMVYDLYYLVVCLYLWISCQLLLASVTSDEQLCSDKSSTSQTGSRPYNDKEHCLIDKRKRKEKKAQENAERIAGTAIILVTE